MRILAGIAYGVCVGFPLALFLINYHEGHITAAAALLGSAAFNTILSIFLAGSRDL